VTAEQTNEIEERRVIRMLAGLADSVPALPDDEIQGAIGSTSALARVRSGRARSRRPARYISAVAAVAVVALAFVVHFEAAAERSSSATSDSAAPAIFPEGSALQLLLSASETSR
jgi:hypothetical protein